ncbi:hypothetical protein [Gluconobacter morbifer]|uniref:Uncharacterized protein n=1 Tax=Gluconobacter morbifer G707 TaxID=1088869 RepID=G6XI32_9PROT|nr:hypothetical protein [Gluconobacter morbifer]EHH68472.1 hypothetical protein GMO_12420 [Gluconobacter morbifer G707]
MSQPGEDEPDSILEQAGIPETTTQGCNQLTGKQWVHARVGNKRPVSCRSFGWNIDVAPATGHDEDSGPLPY